MRRTAEPVTALAMRRGSGRIKESEAALTAQIKQILTELRGIKTAVQTPRRQARRRVATLGASGERDPGDAVSPGVAVQSAPPLSAEDKAVLDKLESEAPEAKNTE
jgi:hypothetical protein